MERKGGYEIKSRLNFEIKKKGRLCNKEPCNREDDSILLLVVS